MLETVLRTQEHLAHLLATAEGERRLTNYLHLGNSCSRPPPRNDSRRTPSRDGCPNSARAATEPKGAPRRRSCVLNAMPLPSSWSPSTAARDRVSRGVLPFPGRPVTSSWKSGGPGGGDDVLFHDPDAEHAPLVTTWEPRSSRLTDARPWRTVCGESPPPVRRPDPGPATGVTWAGAPAPIRDAGRCPGCCVRPGCPIRVGLVEAPEVLEASVKTPDPGATA